MDIWHQYFQKLYHGLTKKKNENYLKWIFIKRKLKEAGITTETNDAIVECWKARNNKSKEPTARMPWDEYVKAMNITRGK